MKTFFKFLLHNKLYTAIDIFGLSVSLGFVVLLLSFAKTEFSIGKNVKDYDNIYACGTGDFIGMTLGTAPEFFPSIPEIKEWTRTIGEEDADVMVGEDYYSLLIIAADDNFFTFFDHHVTGNPSEVLRGTDDAVISQSFAARAFGSENPVGRTFSFDGTDFRITGVFDDFGPEDEFKNAEIIINADKEKGRFQWMDNFGMTAPFVKLQEGASPDDVADKLLDKYCEYWKYYTRDNVNNSFVWGATLTRLDKMYFSPLDKYGHMRSGDKSIAMVLGGVAVILLVSALFNYINLTVAQTGRRAKEMAVRRLVGQGRGFIVRQYVREAFVFTSVCFAIGIVVALLMRPLFNRLIDADIVLAPDATSVIAAVALLAAISLVSGLVPAFFVMRFKPIDVVRGSFRFKSKMVFGRVFIVLQNVISTVLVAVAVAMAMQMHHLATLPVGYNTDGIIFVRSFGIGSKAERQSVLKQRLKALPQVEDVGVARIIPLLCGFNGLREEGKETMSWLRLSMMDSITFRIFGFKIVEQYSDALDGMDWIDRETQQRYGVTRENNVIGNGEGNKLTVCGIVENYRSGTPLSEQMNDSHNAIRIMAGEQKPSSVQVVKVRGDRNEALTAVRKTCSEVAEEVVGMPLELEVEYVDRYLYDSLSGSRNTMTLAIIFMIISVLISALGLLAMSVYYTGQQKRQIALRKVFGYSTPSVVRWLTGSFLKLTLVAIVMAVPLSVIIIRHYLEGFYFRIDFPWIVLPLSVAVTTVVVIASIVGQSVNAASENPVETLNQNG